MRKRLTPAVLSQRPPTSGRVEVRDTDSPLTFRVTSKGHRSLTVRTRLDDRQVRFNYPRAVVVDNLSDARTWAHGIVEKCRQGVDPREEERQEKADTFSEVYAQWLQRDQRGNRSYAEVKRSLDKDVLPRLKDRLITDISRREIIEVLDAIADRGARIHAIRIHARLRRLFQWCVERDILSQSPMEGLPKPEKEVSRDRVLDDDELARIWFAAGKLSRPFGEAIRLLILTGCRRDEIASLRWSEVDLDASEIRISSDRTKNGDVHVVPLSPLAKSILKGLPLISNPKNRKVELALTTTGYSPISGWSKTVRRLNELAAETGPDGRELDEPEPLEPWRLHDLRRTFATGFQRLGIRLEVTEAALNHTSGSRSGITGIYQRHHWAEEKREAINRWADNVLGVVAGRALHDVIQDVSLRPSADVVPIERAREVAE